MKVNFYQDGRDSLLKFAVIVSKSEGKWVFCRHRERDTYEFPGGHREKGENIEEAARRELYEETGAVKYDLKKVCIYSVVREDGLDTESSESFGMLFYADIYQFGPLPAFEIERIELMDSLPDNWTYPDIQPWLLKKIKEWEEDQRCQPFEAVYSSVTGNTKMLPEAVKKRYEDMAKKNPDDERILSFLNNYEKALAHPDEKDLFDLKSMAEKFIKGES